MQRELDLALVLSTMLAVVHMECYLSVSPSFLTVHWIEKLRSESFLDTRSSFLRQTHLEDHGILGLLKISLLDSALNV